MFGLLKNFSQYLWVVYHTFHRDVTAFWCIARALVPLIIAKFRNDSVVTCFSRTCKSHPEKVAFIQDDKKLTFHDIDLCSNRMANYFSKKGIKPGDDVALLMTSRPEQVILLIGLAKIGAVTALVNENLRLDALIHAITCVKSKWLIFDSDLENAVSDVYQTLVNEHGVQLYSAGNLRTEKFHVPNIEDEAQDFPSERLLKPHRANFTDTFCYIYTSGTTGLPKAAVIRHLRYIALSSFWKGVAGIGSSDIVYNAMPLYHTLGGVMGAGSAILGGTTVVIRKKFSASEFWNDCIKYDCTVAIYIGEVLRYLFAQPPKSTDRSHKIRTLLGLGFRRELWKPFVERFNIKHVVEGYGATESNLGLVNLNNKEGSIGFLPGIIPQWLLNLFLPMLLIQVDEEGVPVRDERGFCKICKPGEYGMIVAKIRDNFLSRFDGYVDRKETDRKIIRDVFVKGDAYFSSGDIMYRDELSYIYFKDRTGDTFRWKGENVSTNEVEGLVSKACSAVVDCVCYGVDVPNSEGKAGMVTITTSKELNMNEFYQSVTKVLPKYAVPLFVRIGDEVELTGTFRYSKSKLKREGYDINVISNELYYLDVKKRKYQRLDEDAYSEIVQGKITF